MDEYVGRDDGAGKREEGRRMMTKVKRSVIWKE